MSIKSVPQLQHLAFMASYKDIFTNMAPFRNCKRKRFDDGDDSNEEQNEICPSTRLDETISYVRDRLSQHLIGTMSDTTRKMYVQKFYEALRLRESKNKVMRMNYSRGHWESLAESSIPDISVFLECVLDDSFEELEVDVALPFKDPDQKLIPTIANRSSSLAKITINFSLATPWMLPDPIILSLSALQNLTSLSLHEISGGYNGSNRSIFQCIGQSCPLLSYLSVSYVTVSKKEVLSLIVSGEVVDGIMFEDRSFETKWSLDETLQSLRVPPEYLTPMCSTLRHLHVSSYNDSSMDSTFAFALRHLPLLQNLESNSMAIKIFHDTCGQINSGMQSEFEEICRKTTKKASPSRLVSNFPSLLPGNSLALTSLLNVDSTDPELLAIIGKTCPFLKDAGFKGSHSRSRNNKRKRSWNDDDGEIENTSLQSGLSEWPKLGAVTLYDVPPELVHLILTVFGPELQQLTYNFCSEINLEDLSPCVKLKKLSILNPQSSLLLNSKGNSSKLDFLTQLKSLESDICLGSYWSRIFEEKSSLSRISLYCCHIGTKASSQADWNSIPKMWPQLETLFIRNCSGLTMAIVWKITSQLKVLKTIHLPEKMNVNDLGQLPCIGDYSMTSYIGQPSSIRFIDMRISAEFYRVYNPRCPFLPDVSFDNPAPHVE